VLERGIFVTIKAFMAATVSTIAIATTVVMDESKTKEKAEDCIGGGEEEGNMSNKTGVHLRKEKKRIFMCFRSLIPS
jgi:hypothetical protein